MAPVRPARKERKRYVVYTPRDDRAVLSAYKELFGLVGLAQSHLMALDEDPDVGILRVSHSHTDALKAALVHAQCTSLLTTGTLKKARMRK